MSNSQYGNHSLHGDGTSIWNKFFKVFFQNHDMTSFLKLFSFLMKQFLQTSENRLQTSDTFLDSIIVLSWTFFYEMQSICLSIYLSIYMYVYICNIWYLIYIYIYIYISNNIKKYKPVAVYSFAVIRLFMLNQTVSI